MLAQKHGGHRVEKHQHWLQSSLLLPVIIALPPHPSDIHSLLEILHTSQILTIPHDHFSSYLFDTHHAQQSAQTRNVGLGPLSFLDSSYHCYHDLKSPSPKCNLVHMHPQLMGVSKLNSSPELQICVSGYPFAPFS